jgi:endogenous inhibitor of DNA gyrase (YacG/DUF329 family)
MIEVKCPVCGKQFLARQKNYKLCSPECKKIRVKEQNSSEKYKATAQRYKQTKIYRERYKQNLEAKRKIKFCEICGARLPNANQDFCLDCILDGYQNGSERMKHILVCRGYDSEMIADEIKQRSGLNEQDI